jgi:hypothetical protein
VGEAKDRATQAKRDGARAEKDASKAEKLRAEEAVKGGVEANVVGPDQSFQPVGQEED